MYSVRERGHYFEAAATAGFLTLPDFIQFVHTYSRDTFPLSIIRIFCKFGRKTLRVALLEWLTALPLLGPLPQTTHLKDICNSSDI